MWLALAFFSAFLLGFYDISKKISLNNNAVIPVLLLNTLFCFLFFVPCILGSYLGLISPSSVIYVPFGGWEEHKYIIIKAVIVLSSWYLGYVGLKHLPITLVGPVQATRPVMLLVGAVIVFNERLNLWQWAGVILAVVSFYMMSRSGRKEGISFRHNKWMTCIIVAAMLGAISGLYDKFLMAPPEQGGACLNRMTVQAWYNFYQFLFMGAIFFLFWTPRRYKETPFQWRWAILLISAFLTVADFVYLYALTYPDSMISIVSMVRRSSVLVSFAVGALLFKEHHLMAKAADLVLILFSMVLLWIGTD